MIPYQTPAFPTNTVFFHFLLHCYQMTPPTHERAHKAPLEENPCNIAHTVRAFRLTVIIEL